jgi:hypothetical protein
MLSQIDSEDPSSCDQTHALALFNNERVYSLSASGDVTFAGTLDVANSSLRVEQGLISGHSLSLKNSLHVVGSANVEESLTIGTGFALTPGGLTVDVAQHTGTLFELRSRQAGFNGTLMELSSQGEDSTLIKTVSNGVTTFELSGAGDVRMRGLRLDSGGVHVAAGGIEVGKGLLCNVCFFLFVSSRCCEVI